jgi:hypothetical protein
MAQESKVWSVLETVNEGSAEGDEREVTRSLLVFRLFFRQESGEGDDVQIDLLRTRACIGLSIAVRGTVRSHVGSIW